MQSASEFVDQLRPAGGRRSGKRDVIVSDEVMDLLGRIAQAKGNPRRGLVVCSRNGKKLKSLKRPLMTLYKRPPADYRAKWKLPADYPMVAPNYAEQRRTLAKSIGLGRKKAAPAVVPVPAKAKRAYRKKLSITADA